MKKTLGGQRLGSGNKMTVDLHGFERSTHDLSYIWRSTISSGTLVPFLKEVALSGDTFDINLNAHINTHPTIGPLFGSFKLQLDVFQIPMRLYHSALHNNRVGIGMKMNTVKLPKILLSAPTTNVLTAPDPDNCQINPSCIFSYLGIRGIGAVETGVTPAQGRLFNAVPWLAYWEIYKQYYSNKQEEIGMVITKATTFAINTTVTTVTKGVGGTTIPQTGGASVALNLGQNDTIIVNYTGTAPDPDTIIFTFWNMPPKSATEVSALS